MKEMSASWGVVLIAMVVLAAGTKGLAGQTVDKMSSPATVAVDKSWPEVNLNVVVLDKDGTPKKFDERGFRLFEDGAERPVQVQGSPDSPVSLAVMIDLSGSVFKRKAAILKVVKAIVKELPEGSEVMVVDFNFAAYIDLDFTDASKADFSILDRLQPSGSTALYDAVIATEKHILANAKYARRALVILSDGEDNASQPSSQNFPWQAEQPGAPVVYPCAISKMNIFQSEQLVGHIAMGLLAKWGGGVEFNINPDPEATGARIADAIRNQYVLQFIAADPTRNGKPHKLTVRLPDKGVQIHALPDYFAPAK